MSKQYVTQDDEVVGVFVSRKGAWKTYKDFDGETVKSRTVVVVEADEVADQLAELGEGDDEEGGEAAVRRCKKSPFRQIAKYVKHTTAAGHTSLDNGDKVSEQLRDLTVEQILREVARAAHEAGDFATQRDAVEWYTNKYAKLNPGMRRMNLGNTLRKYWREAGKL